MNHLNHPDITCLLVCNGEGLLAHTTLLSLDAARRLAEQDGHAVELLVVLPDFDTGTEQVLRGNPAFRPGDRLERVAGGGDAASLRNHGVRVARGEYVLFMGGSDYCSSNYVTALLETARGNPGCVAYPQYTFHCGEKAEYTLNTAGNGEDPGPHALFASNVYGDSVAALRKFFLRLPHEPCPSGCGFPVWHWHCRAKSDGLRHKAAPGTVLFRRNAPAPTGAVPVGEPLPAPSPLFAQLPPAQGFFRNRPALPKPSLSLKDCLQALSLGVLRLLPKNRQASTYQSLADLWGRLNRSASQSGFAVQDEPVRAAWREAAHIDGGLHPSRIGRAHRSFHAGEDSGKAFASLWHALDRHDFDLVLVVSHLVTGGADLMAINYARAAADAGMRVLCLLTSGRESPWASRLPDSVSCLHFGVLCGGGFSEAEKTLLFVRLLLQLDPKLIHTLNDSLAIHAFDSHAAALTRRCGIVASLFADTEDGEGIEYGAGSDHLRLLAAFADGIVVDNRLTSESWTRRYGVSSALFHPIYGWTAQEKADMHVPTQRTHVLWAGRLDSDKRPDVLLGIARSMPDIIFDVYGTNVMTGWSRAHDALKKTPNVILHGAYNGFTSIPLGDHFAFLYTTQWDGLPNVLLEATAAGLPLVAPDRGGIRVFVSPETGWLLPEHTNVEAYVAALREIRDNPDEAHARWTRARVLLRERHSREVFARSLMAVYEKVRLLVERRRNSGLARSGGNGGAGLQETLKAQCVGTTST